MSPYYHSIFIYYISSYVLHRLKWQSFVKLPCFGSFLFHVSTINFLSYLQTVIISIFFSLTNNFKIYIYISLSLSLSLSLAFSLIKYPNIKIQHKAHNKRHYFFDVDQLSLYWEPFFKKQYAQTAQTAQPDKWQPYKIISVSIGKIYEHLFLFFSFFF